MNREQGELPTPDELAYDLSRWNQEVIGAFTFGAELGFTDITYNEIYQEILMGAVDLAETPPGSLYFGVMALAFGGQQPIGDREVDSTRIRSAFGQIHDSLFGQMINSPQIGYREPEISTVEGMDISGFADFALNNFLNSAKSINLSIPGTRDHAKLILKNRLCSRIERAASYLNETVSNRSNVEPDLDLV